MPWFLAAKPRQPQAKYEVPTHIDYVQQQLSIVSAYTYFWRWSPTVDQSPTFFVTSALRDAHLLFPPKSNKRESRTCTSMLQQYMYMLRACCYSNKRFLLLVTVVACTMRKKNDETSFSCIKPSQYFFIAPDA
jgi:hypothetical protein